MNRICKVVRFLTAVCVLALGLSAQTNSWTIMQANLFARRLYGEAGHSITLTNPAVPNIVMNYTSFRQITDDISDARVYGGIHFRTDQVAGEQMGRAVGTAVYKNNLRPMHDDN